MKKIANITFHASYNFGSNLQAYALQEYIKKLDNNIKYEILNYRNNIQKEMYDYKTLNNKGKWLYLGKLKKRQEKFEKFINERLNITNQEFTTEQELENLKLNYDYYIAGSDQIWNLSAKEFDWSYFLKFTKKGKKISYAASSGPIKRDINSEQKRELNLLINQFDNISVREQGTYDFIKEFTNKKIEINVDPTILLKKEDWEKLIDNNKKIYEKPYILYYTLKPSFSRSFFVKKLGKKLNKKVIVANPSIKYDIIGGFVKKYESGPVEFLNLVKNADLVISSSFHGTVFSILLNKPFYVINGNKDFRIKTLLKNTNLENRSVDENSDIDEIIKKLNKINFENVNDNLNEQREKSKKYLMNALEIGD